MKAGQTVISPKDNKAEQLILQNGELYGNRTHHNYGKTKSETLTPTPEQNTDEVKE